MYITFGTGSGLEDGSELSSRLGLLSGLGVRYVAIYVYEGYAYVSVLHLV